MNVTEIRPSCGETSHIAFVLALLLCFCGFFLFFHRLGDRDLWASHEARAAQDAQRILDDGNWLTPRLFDDQIELQKPPLYYWLVAAAGWLRGGSVDAVAVRLPAAIAGMATVVVVFLFLAAKGQPWAGLFSAIILATTQHFTWIARTGRIDVPLTFCVTTAVFCLWQARDAAGRIRLLLGLAGYLAIAAGILLKGPVGAVLPATVLLLTAGAARKPLLPRSALWGLPLVCALAGPWFLIAHLRTDSEFTRVFFWYHNVQRATGGAAALASHPWWFYGPRFVFDFLPWSLLMIPAINLSHSYAERRNENRMRQLGMVWFLAMLGVLSLARFKRADYLLPAFPGAAIWLGCVGEKLFQQWRSPQRARWLAFGVACVITGAVIVWAIVLDIVVPRWDAEHGERGFAAAVRRVAPMPQQILLFRVEDHLLAYHLRRPLNTLLEWENLDVWVGRPGPQFVIMPAECADEWRQYITSGSLAELFRYTDRSDRRRPRNLVLMRTESGRCELSGAFRSRSAPSTCEMPNDGFHDEPPKGQQGADQRTAAHVQPGGGS
jgi:4-amino-4-deoxy-L-arabinose transferase-like glycosyltransferase